MRQGYYKSVLFLFVFVACLVAIWLNRDEPAKVEIKNPAPSAIERSLPSLLKKRAGTAEEPLQSWERFLVEDGSPSEDRAALADVVRNYLEAIPSAQRPPMGTNGEITRALSNGEDLGKAAIPADHPARVHGELVDRWGSPWHFHQLSSDLIEVRSAGPDRKLFTADDVVK